MAKREKLLRRAMNNPAGIRFAEACYLAEAYGWQFYHQVGSHRQYRRPGFARSINLQEAKDGMAKPEQV
jgi:predicted RNA binding protein YcfA (HicA-like mRNA interferase family)